MRMTYKGTVIVAWAGPGKLDGEDSGGQVAAPLAQHLPGAALPGVPGWSCNGKRSRITGARTVHWKRRGTVVIQEGAPRPSLRPARRKNAGTRREDGGRPSDV